jgi:Domain of unknown function (DU1801)
MQDPATEIRISDFIDKYTPEISAAIVACRARVRPAFPRGYELIYDNYNALVFGYAASERTSDAVLSIAAYPRWVTLFFLNGASLKDPCKLLEGTGSQVRSVRLKTPEQLDAPSVHDLIAQASKPLITALAAAPPLTTVIKLVSAKQRPRRALETQAKRRNSNPVKVQPLRERE